MISANAIAKEILLRLTKLLDSTTPQLPPCPPGGSVHISTQLPTTICNGPLENMSDDYLSVIVESIFSHLDNHAQTWPVRRDVAIRKDHFSVHKGGVDSASASYGDVAVAVDVLAAGSSETSIAFRVKRIECIKIASEWREE